MNAQVIDNEIFVSLSPEEVDEIMRGLLALNPDDPSELYDRFADTWMSIP